MGEIAQETECGRSYNIQKAMECFSKRIGSFTCSLGFAER
jgi:hypothetical protein